MTANNGTHPYDDLAVYALDAVHGDERHAIEAHLADCHACQAELAAHRVALDALGRDEPPPPDVWRGIARRIGIDPDAVEPSERAAIEVIDARPGRGADRADDPATDDQAGQGRGEADRPVRIDRPLRRQARRPARPTRRQLAGALAAAAAVAAVVGLVLRGVGGAGGAPDLAQLARQVEAADDSARGDLTTLDGSEVARVVSGETGTFVFLDHLDRLPDDRTYQLWRLGGDQPVSLGLLGSGQARVVPVGVPSGPTELAISVEPAGGVVAPTGPIVAMGTLPATG